MVKTIAKWAANQPPFLWKAGMQRALCFSFADRSAEFALEGKLLTRGYNLANSRFRSYWREVT
jgi:hypothetical protein